MSGARLEVVHESDPAKVPESALVIGTLAEKLGYRVPATEWKQAYRIITQGGRVLVNGESPPAISYGIYALLEKLGCDWVMPGKLGEIIPKRSNVLLPDMDETEQPAF